MKGVGTFRRLMGTLGLLGSAAQQLGHKTQPVLSEPEKARVKSRKRRSTARSRKYTAPRKGWPVLYWGTCPRPLSRKALKKLAPEHPFLSR